MSGQDSMCNEWDATARTSNHITWGGNINNLFNSNICTPPQGGATEKVEI